MIDDRRLDLANGRQYEGNRPISSVQIRHRLWVALEMGKNGHLFVLWAKGSQGSVKDLQLNTWPSYRCPFYQCIAYYYHYLIYLRLLSRHLPGSHKCSPLILIFACAARLRL